MVYKERQCRLQEKLIEDGSVFEGVRGGGIFMGKPRPFALEIPVANLYAPIRKKMLERFAENGISWWRGRWPSGHVLSSQIACLNHLAPIMDDPHAVLALVNGIGDGFAEVLPIPCDRKPAFISFEVVSRDDHLNERQATRGSNCTSIDALILARRRSGGTVLIPIEWKYTESYPPLDKSAESGRGEERQRRYNRLIDGSAQLRSLPDYQGSVYYQEPFYQLMRQTLWAEQLVAHRDTEIIKADDFWHVHIVPSGNHELLDRGFEASGGGMESTWRGMLKNQGKYTIADPQALMSPLAESVRYRQLMEYLSARYWR